MNTDSGLLSLELDLQLGPDYHPSAFRALPTEDQTMDQHFHSNTDRTPEDTSKEEHPLRAKEQDRAVQDQQNQTPGGLKGDQGHKLPVAGDPPPVNTQLVSAEDLSRGPGPVPGHCWTEHQDPDQAQNDSGRVPVLLITQTEEQPPLDPTSPSEPVDALLCTEPSLSSGTDGSDLLSLKSDSLSLCSEPAMSRRSDEDETRSVTASSFMSLFHRVQLDPLEKDWMRSSAAGNMEAQRQLLVQEPSLLFKKMALHWAAKQGRQEAVDWMVNGGADVNARCGYTALHLASIHGHQHVVHALIHSHSELHRFTPSGVNPQLTGLISEETTLREDVTVVVIDAQTDIRDYHGKKAVHYWTGSRSVFHKPDPHSRGSLSSGRRMQRYVLPSVLLSRSRSHGQLNLEFGTVPQSASRDTLDLQL